MSPSLKKRCAPRNITLDVFRPKHPCRLRPPGQITMKVHICKVSYPNTISWKYLVCSAINFLFIDGYVITCQNSDFPFFWVIPPDYRKTFGVTKSVPADLISTDCQLRNGILEVKLPSMSWDTPKSGVGTLTNSRI